jgi:NADH-quinone oxidoreductase subunit G
MDVCPVGAITTRQYRFRSRPWDNPNAVDTICTLCEKGCNTTVWIKAKPEWAKGSQIARITPRFNPDVNGYWMCDIGRFQYHWVEGEARLRTPLVRGVAGQQPASWADATARLVEALPPQARAGLRFLVSAHASHEEMFAAGRLAQGVHGDAARTAVTVSWKRTDKAQPAGTKFRVPPVDAPNLLGARALGLVSADAAIPDLAALRDEIGAGRVSALYVVDPGPPGSVGDMVWLIESRRSGRLPFLVVQGAIETDLTRAADVVLPGCAWLEKDASYTNVDGRLQTTSRAILPPGDAREDWTILAEVAAVLGTPLGYASGQDVRQAIAAVLPDEPALQGIASVSFTRPAEPRHWLQASNPMERQKWDALFLDAPPFKFADLHDAGRRASETGDRSTK